jgi:transcriptional regulator with XRE-family HTH domain
MMDNTKQGENRRLMPQEIGQAVAMFRKVVGMKQLTLALEAGVDERTVQRVERGEKVNDDTLRRIAKALRIQEDAFVGMRYVPTSEEAVAEAEKMLSQVLMVEANVFSTVKDCDAVLSALGYLVDDRHVAADLAREVATFKDLLQDCGDIYREISNTEQVEACESVLKQAQKIEEAGYGMRYAVYTTDDKFRISALVILPKHDDRAAQVKQLVVPRRFTEMAWASLRG